MNFATICDKAIQLPLATSDFPFDENTMVFRVMGKMFALVDVISLPTTVNLKCDPELAVKLREKYEAIQPGYHQNKKHWNTIRLDGSISDAEIQELLEHSYNLVVASLSAAVRAKLKSGST